MEDYMCIYRKIMSGVSSEVKKALLEDQELIPNKVRFIRDQQTDEVYDLEDMSIQDKENMIYDLAEELVTDPDVDSDVYVEFDDTYEAYTGMYGYRGDFEGNKMILIDSAEVDVVFRDIHFYDTDGEEYTINSVSEATKEELGMKILDAIISKLYDKIIQEGIKDL